MMDDVCGSRWSESPSASPSGKWKVESGKFVGDMRVDNERYGAEQHCSAAASIPLCNLESTGLYRY